MNLVFHTVVVKSHYHYAIAKQEKCIVSFVSGKFAHLCLVLLEKNEQWRKNSHFSSVN